MSRPRNKLTPDQAKESRANPRPRNRRGEPCVNPECRTVLTEKNSRIVQRKGRPDELKCLRCAARRTAQKRVQPNHDKCNRDVETSTK